MSSSNGLRADELVSGRRYALVLADCCICGEIFAIFVSRRGEYELEFDIGTLTSWAQVTFKETP